MPRCRCDVRMLHPTRRRCASRSHLYSATTEQVATQGFPHPWDFTRRICSKAHIPAMELSNAELICLGYMESVERGEGLPDGCDIESFLRSGLVERIREQWLLTLAG